MWTRVVDEVICIIQNAGGKKTNLFMSLSEPHMYASRISFMDFIMKSIHSLIKMQFFFCQIQLWWTLTWICFFDQQRIISTVLTFEGTEGQKAIAAFYDAALTLKCYSKEEWFVARLQYRIKL